MDKMYRIRAYIEQLERFIFRTAVKTKKYLKATEIGPEKHWRFKWYLINIRTENTVSLVKK